MSKDKQSICVTVRVRPLSNKQLEEDNRICLRVDQSLNLISINGPQKEAKDFYFDSVCDAISQNQMFERVGKRSTVYCMEGYNCTIFAYGQTGAGKTFTMMGINPQSRDYFEQRGLVPRTLQHLFECIEKQITDSGVDYIIRCSFVQIYNEQIIDLLGTANNALNIRQDLKKGVYIQGVTQEIISQSQEAMEILRKGSKGRHVGSTFYNQTSSRSHSVFTMQIQSQQLSNGIKSTKSRHFHFIDLAGSQRTKKSMGDRLKEGCSINKSLHVLSMVISSLAEVSEGKARHVNYRDSKLTFLLKDSLGGNSKTHLIANISPSFISSLQTKSTLMFARKVKLIKVNKVSINEDASGNLESLKQQIRRLRSENILLRNGNTSLPPTIAEQSFSNNNNTKMVGVLQQYIDQQIEKQTKMELQITKLQNKNSYLQKGIKHFSDNERQLRMVLSIYEDKIKKLKKAESLMIEKIQQINGGQRIEEIKKYFQEERQILLDQIERYKQLSSSSSLVKNLLRELKVIKENPEVSKEQGQLIAVLTKNNNFLQQIKSSIIQLEPEMQQGKASKAVIQQNEQLKAKNQELFDQIQKYGLELAEAKDKIQQTETLLSEAISTQIVFEKKIQQEELLHKQALQSNFQEIIMLKNQLEKAQQQIKTQLSKENELELVISQHELQISQSKSQLLRLKQKKESEQSVYQQRLEILTAQNKKMEEIIRKKIQEHQKLKSQSFQLKSQNERIKQQTSGILGDASSRIQQLQEQIQKSQNEKAQIRSKFERSYADLEEKLNMLSKEKQQLSMKFEDSSNDRKNFQQEILKQQQQVQIWKEKYEQNLRSQEQERSKWQENNLELIRMINQKKACDSQTQGKLTQSQLQIINLNEKLAQLNIQYKKSVENLNTFQTSSMAKTSELEEQLSGKQQLLEQIKSQNSDMKRKLQILTQSQHSLKRQTKNLEDQITHNEQQKQKLGEQIQKLKKKQKQGRISINELKNQTYALKKNYQIEIQTAKEQLRGKQDEINSLINQNANLKESNEKSMSELQRKMETQFEIFKQNEGSIKRALETHLINKEKKINQLKTLSEAQEQQLKQKITSLTEVQKKLDQTVQRLNKQINLRQKVQNQRSEVEQSLFKCQQTMNALQNDHLRAVQEMENRFNQECDIKNAEIDRLRRRNQENQPKVARLPLLQEQANLLKSELINRQAFCQELLSVKQVLIQDLQAIRNNGQQANNYVVELEAQLKDKQTYIVQLNQNFKMMEQGINGQLEQKQAILQKLDSALHSSQLQIQNLHRLNQKINHEKNEAVSAVNQQLRNVLMTVEGLERQNMQLKQNIEGISQQFSRNAEYTKEIQNQVQKKSSQESQIIQFLSQYLNFQTQVNQPGPNLFERVQQLASIIHNLENEKMNLQNGLEQTTNINMSVSEQNRRLIQILRQIQQQNQIKNNENNQNNQAFRQQLSIENKKNEALAGQLRETSEKNINLQRETNQLQILVQRKHKQIQNLELHLISVQKKAQAQQNLLNQRLNHLHQESSLQINKLNELYEKSKQKLEVMKNDYEKLKHNQYQTKSNYQTKIQQLENQIYFNQEQLAQAENDINNQRQKNEELQKYIDELGFKINGLQQQKQRLVEQLQQFKVESEKRLKQSQKRCQLGAAQMNSLREQIKLIQDEASVWKQRMQNLQNEIRLANQRAEKFRVQYMKEKDSNKQFKLLLDNAHCQIQSFRNQVMDKDKLYHQLLEKVSKNDIQRKGLINQDKKFSDLLEKSRIEVSQVRKKYDDQLKINNLLKQQIEKKDIDLSVVKEKSQEYCKKHQSLIESIKSDYSKIEIELKTTQNSLTEARKALKKVTLKNEQLEDQLHRLNNDYIEVQKHNDELKKQSLKSGIDQRQIGFVNKLKEENSQLKRQLDKVSEEMIIINQQKMRMKNQFKSGKEADTLNLQLSKKNSQVKYLQKIIDDSVNALGIRDYKKSVGQSLKTGIIDLQRELAKSKSDITQLADEINIKNQKLQILQNPKFKSILTTGKQEQDTLAKMRNKIGRVTSNFESIRQSKEEQKSILQSKDPNKSNLWGNRN